MHETAHPIVHEAPVEKAGVVHEPLACVAGRTSVREPAAVAMEVVVAESTVVVVADPSVVVVADAGAVEVVADPCAVVVVADPSVVVVLDPTAVLVVADAGTVVVVPDPPSPSGGIDDCEALAAGGSFES